ncbi:Dehydrogenase aclE [Colletotrichum siamense]|nr:Dehydrogenase aclE [Colletotrichum siamense]
MPKDPIKVGFVGLSSQPAWSWSVAAHLPYFATTSNYKIVALQNSSTETAQKAARIHNLGEDIAAYGDIQSTVSDPNIDLVAVCLKVPAHLPIIEAALKAGKAVFSEWPLARNVAEAEYLANLAAEQGARTLVGLQGRHDPSVLKARDMVAGGELGDILQTTMLFTSPWFGASFPADVVFATDIENGANLMSISGILANNRPVVPLVDSEGKQQGTIKTSSHDHCTVTGRLAGGGVATAVCQGGMSAIDKNFFWEITDTKGTLVLEGPMGNIQGFQPTVSFVKAEAGVKLEKIEVEEAKGFSFNTGRAWEAFAGEGEGAVPDFQDALLRHRMLEAIYRSSEKGTRDEYM